MQERSQAGVQERIEERRLAKSQNEVICQALDKLLQEQKNPFTSLMARLERTFLGEFILDSSFRFDQGTSTFLREGQEQALVSAIRFFFVSLETSEEEFNDVLERLQKISKSRRDLIMAFFDELQHFISDYPAFSSKSFLSKPNRTSKLAQLAKDTGMDMGRVNQLRRALDLPYLPR